MLPKTHTQNFMRKHFAYSMHFDLVYSRLFYATWRVPLVFLDGKVFSNKFSQFMSFWACLYFVFFCLWDFVLTVFSFFCMWIWHLIVFLVLVVCDHMLVSYCIVSFAACLFFFFFFLLLARSFYLSLACSSLIDTGSCRSAWLLRVGFVELPG